jgi:NAD(P)-dependent dehydrogenase (short-subunit alcohol dehydrogenase family)
MQRTVAIVTGGASGIGAAVVKQIVGDDGCAGIFDLNAPLAETLAKDLGSASLAVPGSVLSEDDLDRARAQVEEKFGPINALVCAAGIPQVPARIEEFALSEWTQILESHLTGTFAACRIIGSAMAKRAQGGAIVNLASVVGIDPGPTLAYGPAKAGVINLTKILAVQWAKAKVRVNAVAPGWTDTPFLRPPARGGKRDLTPIENAVPMGRVLAPEEIAAPILFLLSPGASAITGVVLPCDGGFLAGAGWSAYGGFEI